MFLKSVSLIVKYHIRLPLKIFILLSYTKMPYLCFRSTQRVLYTANASKGSHLVFCCPPVDLFIVIRMEVILNSHFMAT